MPLSSNSIFHYTKYGMKAIKGILSEGFWVSYSFEYLPTDYKIDAKMSYPPLGKPYPPGYIIKPSRNEMVTGYSIEYIKIPMVSFCDIPISNISIHLNNYGTPIEGKKVAYAIGLTKKWAINNGLNQVIYVIPGSELASVFASKCKKNSEYDKYIQDLWRKTPGIPESEKYFPPKPIEIIDGEIKDNKGNTLPFEVLFLKPIGEVVNEDFSLPIRLNSFVDEKEWRYVPENTCIISGSEVYFARYGGNLYSSIKQNVDKAVEEAKKNYKNLSFEADDITHIIVAKDDEIPEIQKHLREEFKGERGVSDDQLYLLFSKVTSYETLQRDFFTH